MLQKAGLHAVKFFRRVEDFGGLSKRPSVLQKVGIIYSEVFQEYRGLGHARTSPEGKGQMTASEGNTTSARPFQVL